MTPNRACAADAAAILATMSTDNAADGLRKIVAAVAARYGCELAAAFADIVVEEMHALQGRTVH